MDIEPNNIHRNPPYYNANLSYSINRETGDITLNSISPDTTIEGDLTTVWDDTVTYVPWETPTVIGMDLIKEIQSFSKDDIIFIKLKKGVTDKRLENTVEALENTAQFKDYQIIIYRDDEHIEKIFSLKNIITPEKFTINIGANGVTTNMEEAIRKENKERERIRREVEELRQVLRRSGRLRDRR